MNAAEGVQYHAFTAQTTSNLLINSATIKPITNEAKAFAPSVRLASR